MYYKFIIGAFALSVLTLLDASAQKRPSIRKIKKHDHFSGMFKPGDPSSDFLTTQYWLGYKSGASVTSANAQNAISIFIPIVLEEQAPQKDYKSYKGITAHAGLELTIYRKGFYFSLQPEFRRMNINYENAFLWESTTNPERSIQQDLIQNQRLDYINFPFLVKYDLTQGAIKPFIQAGAFYGTLVGATREIKRQTTDNASGAQGSVFNDDIAINNKASFINSHTGYILGAGFNFDAKKARIVFDLQYRKSFNNVTNVKTRFDDDRLNTFGDVLDDMKLTNLSASIGILFPLKYLGSGETVNKK